MYSFELTILGASGGPEGGVTQCFMVRPSGTRGVESICVDGGAGAGQITRMIARYGPYANPDMVESFYANDVEPAAKFFDAYSNMEFGLPSHITTYLENKEGLCNTRMKAIEIYNGIKEYYVTHAHLDHISEMVLNSPLAYEDNPSLASKKIWGLDFTVEALKKHLFNDLVWPDLVSDNERFQLGTLKDLKSHRCSVFPQWDIIPLQVNHGHGAVLTMKRVYSTVYLFRDRETKNCLLVCGDIEADFSLGAEKSLFCRLLKYIAGHVDQGKLRGIVIECSSSMSTDESQLYGHLSPVHLVDALVRLQNMYAGKDSLKGLEVIISHVKRVSARLDPRLTILDEIREQALLKGLEGIIFSMAVHGFTFHL
ncbi:hypothetical protein HG535_0G05070 [Zygotorulaspora mrakii]|uniref:3',5'-cyclic-nucleotide phosphodiesterase n=1 Tax=Zygotorulaspora mrakii TaxID=42260 RepID=A0A7H9B8Q0_ZYGMR|nr:uncharacterized protein HG535_0G05070 [Zygotorulaspora mrakii]QLG74624.1 hypothetical protein HG535_0G05070 [Zygotorulaspora mrakii]